MTKGKLEEDQAADRSETINNMTSDGYSGATRKISPMAGIIPKIRVESHEELRGDRNKFFPAPGASDIIPTPGTSDIIPGKNKQKVNASIWSLSID